jgi:predicted methyltransferase
LAAGASVCAVAPAAPARAAVLANNGEVVAHSDRAAADYIRRGDLTAEHYVWALLDRYKAHTNLNTVTYIERI